ncbi:unnamed protein product [Heterobilharzia americana]|nr:unnamed protein product [Heterobilharzia americana]
MEAKANEFHRFHRKLRSEEDDKWDCSVCTYINPKESYKCEICHTRKGTSTRKPRLNTQVVEQQQLIAQTILKEKDDEHKKKRESRCKQAVSSNFRLKHFDRSSPLLFEIFANGYSVIITEFQPKSSKSNIRSFSESPALSNCSSHQGFGVNPSTLADDISSTDSLTNVPIKYPSKSGFGTTRSGLSSAEEPLRPCRSYSSASSSVGGNTLSRASSPPNSIGPCLSDVKREQAALEAEQAAHDGDDECEEEENAVEVVLSNESKQDSPSGSELSKRSILRSVSLNSSCPSQSRRGNRDSKRSSKRFKKPCNQCDTNSKPQKRQRFEELSKLNSSQHLQNGSKHEEFPNENDFNDKVISSSNNCNISNSQCIFPDDELTIHSSPDHNKEQKCTVSLSQPHPRLSTESKNTSAMTDSSGATALEMSS